MTFKVTQYSEELGLHSPPVSRQQVSLRTNRCDFIASTHVASHVALLQHSWYLPPGPVRPSPDRMRDALRIGSSESVLTDPVVLTQALSGEEAALVHGCGESSL